MYLYSILCYYILILVANIVMKDHFAKRKYSNQIVWFMNIIGLIALIINAHLIFSQFKFTLQMFTFLFTAIIPYLVLFLILYENNQIMAHFKNQTEINQNDKRKF